MDWYQQLRINLQQMTVLEAVAMSLGIVSVLMLQAGRVWGYVLGMLSVGAYVWICFAAKLYAHMGVNAYYMVMNVYGWYHWQRGGTGGRKARYGYCSYWEYGVGMGVGLLAFGLLYVVLGFTDSTVAFWDALTTAIWMVAMWGLARKRIENWLAWMVADLISIPLYFAQGLLLTSLQMGIFFCIAFVGFWRWRHLYRLQWVRES